MKMIERLRAYDLILIVQKQKGEVIIHPISIESFGIHSNKISAPM